MPGIRLPGVVQTTRHVVDAVELASVASAMGDEAPMAYLGAVLGLRWGECAGPAGGPARLPALDPRGGRALTRGPRGVMVLGPPKSQAGRRTMALPPALMALLSEHMAWRGITGADPDQFVFPAPQGGHLDYAHFRRRVWIPATAVAGVEGLAFHDLRRANATAMVLDGIDLKTA